ncbi:MAG: nucleotidyltransferase domain-containing protein [Endomicrobia bacterium]|nr:nucleotidyltransferase domain-containing protein [Endomicrobiia bacterium]
MINRFRKRPFTINEIKKMCGAVAKKHGVNKVYLFGSYAKGKADKDSDIDICIEKGKIRTLFQLSDFYMDINKAFGKNVDVVTTKGVKRNFKNSIKKDFIEIYG